MSDHIDDIQDPRYHMTRQIFFLREDDKKGYIPQDTDKKGDTDFC